MTTLFRSDMRRPPIDYFASHTAASRARPRFADRSTHRKSAIDYFALAFETTLLRSTCLQGSVGLWLAARFLGSAGIVRIGGRTAYACAPSFAQGYSTSSTPEEVSDLRKTGQPPSGSLPMQSNPSAHLCRHDGVNRRTLR